MTAELHCSRCGADNRAGRRYCAQCGAALPVACGACGFANEATENYCGGCGSPLDTHAMPRAPVAPAPAASIPPGAVADEGGGERRPVTVLFADLVDYTRMSRKLDPEDVHAMLERYYRAADAIVERCGGTVDKHIGDSVMAVFGAPVAHGNESIRALRAAAEIHRAMPTIDGGAAAPLAVHIGIASGEVVASGIGSAHNRAYTVIGNSVNLAARLLKLAGSGETVLDEAVHVAVRSIARCTPIEGSQVKGIDAPVNAWRFEEFADAAEGDGAHPFVGRRAEIAQLSASLATCAETGAGGTLYVRGDAGIGKSRLVGELRRVALAHNYVCHSALVLDFGMASGRDAIREIVASVVGLPPGSDAAVRGAALEAMLVHQPELANRRAFLLDLLDLPQSAASGALYAAMDNAARQRGREAVLIGLIDSVRAEAPALVIVEDVHWADPLTLDYLAAIARAAASKPMVLALTSRVQGDPLDAAWRGSVQGCPIVTIDLGPLAAKDALALAGGFVSLEAGLVQKCIARAGGNPLFLEQLMRAANDDDDRLPASLSSLVLARMDRLADQDRVALRAASAIGQRFSLVLLRHVCGQPGYDCAALVANFLVRPEGDEFLFAHALIREGVYASLTRARRTELHRAAAQWYATRDLALVAEHLDRADAAEAPRAYFDAANAQATALHPDRALALARRGVALARDPVDVVALNMLEGRLTCESGDGAPAVAAYRNALAAATDPVERCRALIGVAAGLRLIAGVDAAFEALAEAEPLARRQDLGRELAELHYTRGNLHFARGEIAACRSEHEAALAWARRLADPMWEARATSGLADAAYAAGRMLTALQRFRECIALCDAHGLTRVAIPNRIMHGHCRTYVTEFDEGIADIRRAGELAVEVGDRHAEMFALEAEGELLTFCNRYGDAEPVLARALALAETIKARRYQAILLAAMAACSLGFARVAEARERIDRALPLARETGMRFCGPLILAIKARLCDDARERELCRREGEALIAECSMVHNVFEFHRHGIEDALARGTWSRGLDHAAALEAYTREEPTPYGAFLVSRCRVLVGLHLHPQDPSLRAELARLREFADRIRWPIGWPAWVQQGEAAPRGT